MPRPEYLTSRLEEVSSYLSKVLEQANRSVESKEKELEKARSIVSSVETALYSAHAGQLTAPETTDQRSELQAVEE